MAQDAIIFALANPDPEIHPDVARRYAAVVATGRSDFPNQINNVLAFPGIFGGALEVRATGITEGMKLAAADALAALVGDDPSPEYVIPSRSTRGSPRRSPPRWRRRPAPRASPAASPSRAAVLGGAGPGPGGARAPSACRLPGRARPVGSGPCSLPTPPASMPTTR